MVYSLPTTMVDLLVAHLPYLKLKYWLLIHPKYSAFSLSYLLLVKTLNSLYVSSDKVSLKVMMMPTTLLGMLSSKLLDGILTHGCVKLRCVIVTILWVRIQYKCATCDKLVVGEKCAPFCSLQQPKFSVECK